MGKVALEKKIGSQSTGAKREFWGIISPSSSYATGGDDLNIEKVTSGVIREAEVVILNGISNSGTYRAYIIYGANSSVKTVKMMIFVVATGAQVAATTDLSAERFRVIIRGN